MIDEFQLYREASRWLGTPWLPNSAEPGRGVSCHNLPRTILINLGALPQDFPPIVGVPQRGEKVSRMIAYVDGCKEFSPVSLEVTRVNPEPQLQPGDLLGIRIYRCVDHLALYLGRNQFIHVLMHKHVSFDNINVPPWKQRIERAWRIR
jgi:cell wall-associated NlpC family hydrolase